MDPPFDARDAGSRHTINMAILGSTGSIGCNTIDVARHLGPRCNVVGLAASQNWEKLAAQANDVRPKVVALGTESQNTRRLKDALRGSNVVIEDGPDSLTRMARRDDVQTVVAAIVGAVGLPAVIAAAEAGKTIALANKEALVVAGSLVVPLAKKHHAAILPVDSEHSAIHQSLRSGLPGEVHKIILTASGGPFRTWDAAKLQNATLEQALEHPNWKMGPKITIDSATLMNKALEIVEAHWLFDLPAEKIEVVIHPQSIIHSMIEFVDGSIIAQLGTPDMRTPIQYALTHPERYPGCSHRLDWSKMKELTFEQPAGRFRALDIGFEVVRTGGTSGAVVNAANETANAMFRDGKIRFGEIVQRVDAALSKHRTTNFVARPTLEQLLEADAWARQETAQ